MIRFINSIIEDQTKSMRFAAFTSNALSLMIGVAVVIGAIAGLIVAIKWVPAN